MQKIRKDYLSESTVTIHLIGEYGAENRGKYKQRFIKRELQTSLYDEKDNTRNGILGAVLPPMYDRIYKVTSPCWNCGNTINIVAIDDSTVIKEFSHNYYISNDNCHHSEEERYCVLVIWRDFC